LARLYGQVAYQKLRQLRVAVVGLGGVGSWTVEALARCGVAKLVLLDMDHVAESNINRQVQATTHTLGMAKGEALKARVHDIHPGCEVVVVDAFVEPENWPTVLPCDVDVLVDACDASKAKLAMARWAVDTGVKSVVVGAAGGKQDPQHIAVAALPDVTHDPLLKALRDKLRRDGERVSDAHMRASLVCVYSKEALVRPTVDDSDYSLNCHGYGSSVMVTAAFGLTAAAQAVRLGTQGP
jgi:tRNA threonylcarbamoyladenosine dehydratase